MSYYGDVTLGDTIHVKFSTVATTGAPTTLAGTPAVSAYVGGSLTQITAGVTLTVDYDGVTGLHDVTVVASGANGFTTATNVSLVITAGTVSGTSVVGYVVGSFSIGNRSAFARLGAPAGASVSADIAAVKVDTAATVADTNELQTDWANGGRLDLLLDGAALETTLTAMKGATFDGSTDSLEALRNRGDSAWITATGFATPTNITAATGITLAAVTHTGAVIPTVTTLTGHTAQTGDTYALANGATGFAAIDTVVDAIKAKTDSMTFTTAGLVDANVQQINDVTITGDGAPGTEFGV